MTRALQAVKLLSRIRQEKPELWKQIRDFAKQEADRGTPKDASAARG